MVRSKGDKEEEGEGGEEKKEEEEEKRRGEGGKGGRKVKKEGCTDGNDRPLIETTASPPSTRWS